MGRASGAVMRLGRGSFWAGKRERERERERERSCPICSILRELKLGQIHGKKVADNWAGAIMQKRLAIQIWDTRMDRQMDGQIDTDRQMDRRTKMARCRVACPRLKNAMDGPTDGQTKPLIESLCQRLKRGVSAGFPYLRYIHVLYLK